MKKLILTDEKLHSCKNSAEICAIIATLLLNLTTLEKRLIHYIRYKMAALTKPL